MNRGEVWRLAADSSAEKYGANQRVVIILSSDALAVLPLRVVVPLLVWRETFATAPWMVRVPPVLNSGLERVMAADALQVRSVSTVWLTEKLGSLPDRITNQVSAAVDEIILP